MQIPSRQAEIFAKAIEVKAEARIVDKKEAIKSELYNELPSELATKEFVRAEINELWSVIKGIIPSKATEDTLHIAIATVHKMDFLLTWNCKHIANTAMRLKIESICNL